MICVSVVSKKKDISKRHSYVFEEFLSNDTSPGVNGQFHLADLFVDLLHEVDDKVHQLVFVHLLRVEVGNQEANIISLKSQCEGGK